MARIGRTARWIVAGVLILAAYVAYPTFERFLELQNTNQLLLTALSLALVVLAAGLVGVLVRNLVRLIVDRKRGLLGSRLRTKLVFFFLVLVLPSSTVLFIGSAQVIKETVEAILRTPLEELSRQSGEIVEKWQDYFQESGLEGAAGLAEQLARRDLLRADRREELDATLAAWSAGHDLERVTIVLADGRRIDLDRSEPPGAASPALDALVDRVRQEGRPVSTLEHAPEGLRVRAAVPVGHAAADVLAVSSLLPPFLAGDLDGFSEAVRQYKQFRLHRRELVRLYMTSIALIYLVTVLIATWIGFYMARRITAPIQQMASATREISAGNLDVRVRADAGDEVGTLVESFNEMAAELQESRSVITRSTADLRRSNRALDERRRYIETLIENLSTGVLSLDPAGRATTANPALADILGVELRAGDDAAESFRAAGLDDLAAAIADRGDPPSETVRRDLVLRAKRGTVQVAVHVSPLLGAAGESLGTLLMVEDLTDLVQAQRAAAWREVARRIAHEIKNPLTPIQLSAQRLRRKLRDDPEELRRVLPEATASIEREVGALKSLVDEFSRFARMPEVRTRPTDVRELVDSVLSLYESVQGVTWEVAIAQDVGEAELDPDQIRRVLINLIDNALAALEADGGGGIVRLRAERPAPATLMLTVEDSGPGIPAADRDKMFAPYFSTKKRGTGLGLAIVHKVVTDHRGTIRVEDPEPGGARFVIELPA